MISQINCGTDLNKVYIENTQQTTLAIIMRDIITSEPFFYVTSTDETEIYYKIYGQFKSHEWNIKNGDEIVASCTKSVEDSLRCSYVIEISSEMDYVVVVMIALAIDEYYRQESAKQK